MKLIPERQKMIDTVLAGFGEVGNDLFGKHLAGYSARIPQHDQDIEQAKSLLKSAGQSNLKVTLQTTDALPGLTDAATFYAQEAKKAGVTVSVKTVPGSSYFNPSLLFMKMPFAQDSLADRLALPRLPPARHLDRAGQRGPLDELDVRRAGAGGRVDAQPRRSRRCRGRRHSGRSGRTRATSSGGFATRRAALGRT